MQHLFGHPLKAHRPHVRVCNIVIQQNLPEFPKQCELFIGRACHGFAEFLQLLLGFTVTAPDTLVKELHDNVRVMQEGLLKESDEHGVAPLRRHALQGLIGRLPANLR